MLEESKIVYLMQYSRKNSDRPEIPYYCHIARVLLKIEGIVLKEKNESV
jgi:hypothetical protein